MLPLPAADASVDARDAAFAQLGVAVPKRVAEAVASRRASAAIAAAVAVADQRDGVVVQQQRVTEAATVNATLV